MLVKSARTLSLEFYFEKRVYIGLTVAYFTVQDFVFMLFTISL